MPPIFALNLSNAGFDFMNMANNHMNDFGAGGIASTIRVLDSFGIKSGGAYGKECEFVVDRFKIAILCFATSPNTRTIFEIKKAQHMVAQASRTNDLVIVSFHGGGEGSAYLHTRDTMEYFLGNPRGNVVKFAHAVVDSGADLVWGHGPHVPRALEIYKGRMIAYSLGNFCTWGFNLHAEKGYAPLIKLFLNQDGVFLHGRVFSAVQKPGHGVLLDSLDQAAKLIKKLSSEDFPDSSPEITEQGFIFPNP